MKKKMDEIESRTEVREIISVLEKYVDAARALGIDGKDDKEVFKKLLDKLTDLKHRIGIKDSIREYGIDEKDFLKTLDEMTENAFDDQCTGANPRYPLMSEIKKLYLMAYYGKDYTEPSEINESEIK